jgi:hypothetical protein
MLIGLTATAVAQTPQARSLEEVRIVGGTVIANGTTREYSGGVKFIVNGLEISADEATSDNRTGVLSLRGNVQVKLLK